MTKLFSGALLCIILYLPKSLAQQSRLPLSTGPEIRPAQTFLTDSLACHNKCLCDRNFTPAGIMISQIHEKGKWMVSYRHMQMRMEGMVNGSKSISSLDVLNTYSASGTSMNMQMRMLMFMYGFSNRLTLMGMLHYNTTYMEMTMKSGNHQHTHAMKTEGMGDTKLYALYAVINKNNVQLLLSTGLNVPTGAINLKGNALNMMYPGMRLPYAMQPGSGSWDVLPGVTVTHSRERSGMSLQFTATKRFFNNALGYRLGDECVMNLWYAHNWFSFLNNSLRVEGVLAKKIINADPTLPAFTEPAANSANYGGSVLHAYFGTGILIKKGILNRFRLSVEYGLPLYYHYNGTQMPNKQTLIIHLSFNH